MNAKDPTTWGRNEWQYSEIDSTLDWFFKPSTSGTSDNLTGTAKTADLLTFTQAPSFGTGNADTITNFNPKEKDKLQIQLSQFGADAAGTFKVAKNTKALGKALATSTDFIYLKSRGELYYNENGKQSGFGDGGVFAILEGNPIIKAANIGFI
jgi:Ca2+-binding RTX toxin-like protein